MTTRRQIMMLGGGAALGAATGAIPNQTVIAQAAFDWADQERGRKEMSLE